MVSDHLDNSDPKAQGDDVADLKDFNNLKHPRSVKSALRPQKFGDASSPK